MPIEVTCDLCFRDHKVKSEFAGKTFKCKGCGEPLTAPKLKRRPQATVPVEKASFNEPIKKTTNKLQKSPPPKVATRKPKNSASSASAKKSKPSASSGIDDGNMKAIMGGVGTVLLLLMAVGLKLANKTDILDRLIPSGVGWTHFELRNGDVTLDMPSTPKPKIEHVPEAIAHETFVAEARQFATSAAYVQFDTSQIPELGRSIFTIGQMKTDLIREFRNVHPGTTLEREETVMVDGVPVLVVVTISNIKNVNMRIFRYCFLAGDTLYGFEFAEQTNRTQDSQREHFVNSVRFSEKVKTAYRDWQGKFESPGTASPENQDWNSKYQQSPEPSEVSETQPDFRGTQLLSS